MHINTQPISKINHKQTGDNLLVHTIFKTIQGEGPFAGEPAVFIRLGGCNLQCPMCDTEYTNGTIILDIEEIIHEVNSIQTPNQLVVITGGEPFRQDITFLVKELLVQEYKVQIETNGTIFLEGFPYGSVTTICSPKAGKVNKKLQPYIKAYKYVLSFSSYSEEDGLPITALDHPAKPQLFRPPEDSRAIIYLQPADEQVPSLNKINTKITAALCKQFGYTFCFQIHKHIGED